MSLDIDNIYGNIPKEQAIQVLQITLEKSDSFTKEEITDIIRITKIIMNQSYFKYNDAIYYDPTGLPMGGPLSATLAELYIQHFEEQHIIHKNNPYLDIIKLYTRYVDDLFFNYSGNERQAKLLHNYINKVKPNINFKIEMEKDKFLNYLYVTVKHVRFNYNRDIRKPTQTDLVIPQTSNHPIVHKLASFRSMITDS